MGIVIFPEIFKHLDIKEIYVLLYFSMSAEQEIYHAVITTCIGLLVQELDVNCEPALNTMIKMPWSPTLSTVDQGIFIIVFRAGSQFTSSY